MKPTYIVYVDGVVSSVVWNCSEAIATLRQDTKKELREGRVKRERQSRMSEGEDIGHLQQPKWLYFIVSDLHRLQRWLIWKESGNGRVQNKAMTTEMASEVERKHWKKAMRENDCKLLEVEH